MKQSSVLLDFLAMILSTILQYLPQHALLELMPMKEPVYVSFVLSDMLALRLNHLNLLSIAHHSKVTTQINRI